MYSYSPLSHLELEVDAGGTGPCLPCLPLYSCLHRVMLPLQVWVLSAVTVHNKTDRYNSTRWIMFTDTHYEDNSTLPLHWSQTSTSVD